MDRTDIGGLVLRRRHWQPWLLVLLGINTGRPDTSHETLRAVEPVDVELLVLAGVTYAGFWPGPGARHAWWMVLAVGDLATSGPPRRVLAPVIAAGYAGLTVWFGWLAVLLLG